MLTSSNLLDIDKITSLETITKELERLKYVLTKNEMRQLLIFHNAYLVVTSNIQKASKEGYFDNPKFIEELTISFACYYFQVVNQTKDDIELPKAWDTLNKAAQKKATPNFILLLLGANAHINHDLILVLTKLREDKETGNLLQDFIKMDKILMKSGREIIATFSEPSKQLDFLKRRVIFMYYRPVMYMIRFWRLRAWTHYLYIKRIDNKIINA